MNKDRSKYEIFHKATRHQLNIIKENNFTYRIILNVLNKYLNPENYVLDIGCGAGTISFYLSNRSKSVVGIDISQSAINSCKLSAKEMDLKNIKFFQMDFPQQLPEGEYDLITCFEVIEHLRDDKLAIKKIYTMLKPGGIMILSTPSKNAPLYKLGLARKFDERVGHLRRYDMNELKRILENANFSILETRKTEGIIRNLLFLNPIAGKSVRFIRSFMVNIISFLDDLSLEMFGESDLFIVAQKPL